MLFVFYLISALAGAAIYIRCVGLGDKQNCTPLDIACGIGFRLEAAISILLLLAAGQHSLGIGLSGSSLLTWVMSYFWTIYIAQWIHVAVMALWCNGDLRKVIIKGVSCSLKRFGKLI
jgi:hypothetical protein